MVVARKADGSLAVVVGGVVDDVAAAGAGSDIEVARAAVGNRIV